MRPTEAGPVRGVLRFVRHLPDRLLHSVRGRRLRRRLAGRPHLPGEILFVCHGNVCRSPYAEVAFRGLLPAEDAYDPTLRSAGFVGPGRPSPDAAIRVARGRGVELTDHRSCLLTVAGVRSAELIVVMNAEQRRDVSHMYGDAARRSDLVVLGDLDPKRIHRRGILDPFRGDDADFDESYARIDRCLHEFAVALGVISTNRASTPGASEPRSPGRVQPTPR